MLPPVLRLFSVPVIVASTSTGESLLIVILTAREFFPGVKLIV